MRAAAAVGLFLLVSAACAPGEPEPVAGNQHAAGSPTPSRIVDSIFPIEEEIRRFREVLGPEPTGLSGGAASRDALVDRFVQALAAADTATFADLVMSRDEFGWLYYPHTRFTAPPYELPPALVWFQLENGSSRGLGRLLQRVAGRPLDVLGYACDAEPAVEGPHRLWEGCVLRLGARSGEPESVRWFGTIIERGGVFKFVSYTNDF